MSDLNYELFFPATRLPRLRELYKNHPRFSEFREELDQYDRAEGHRFLKEDLDHNDQLQHLNDIAVTAGKMAFHFLMTGNEASARLSADCIRGILKFNYWDFFLTDDQVMGVQRAPSSIIAISEASDWLGDFLSVEERREWIRAMGEHGCEPCFRGIRGIRSPRKAGFWRINPDSGFFNSRPDTGGRHVMVRRPEITHNTNLRAVPASALAVGCFATEAEFGVTEEVVRWKEMARFNLEVFREIWEADGSYHEAVNYGNYTAKHLLQAALVFQQRGDASLNDLINWGGFSRFLFHLKLPTELDPAGVVNFGDSGNFPPTSGGNLKLSAHRQAVTMVPFYAGAAGDAEAQWIGENLEAAEDYWALICYDPDAESRAPDTRPQLWTCDLDWAVVREGWEAEDMVLALRSGVPGNHEHADRNSFLLKAYGEPLITDPFRCPYSCNDPAWVMRTTLGHSAVLVDGEGHGYVNGSEGTNASYAKAVLLNTEFREGVGILRSDATQPYRLVNLDVWNLERGMAVFLDEKVIIVADHLEKHDHPSTLEARFFAYNNDGKGQLAVTDNEFWVTRPGAYLRGNVYSNVTFHGRQDRLDIPEDQAKEHPFAAFRSEEAQSVTMLSVLVAGKPDETPPEVRCSVEGEKFHVVVAGREARIERAVISVV